MLAAALVQDKHHEADIVVDILDMLQADTLRVGVADNLAAAALQAEDILAVDSQLLEGILVVDSPPLAAGIQVAGNLAASEVEDTLVEADHSTRRTALLGLGTGHNREAEAVPQTAACKRRSALAPLHTRYHRAQALV